MTYYEDDDLLMLSGIQHFAFCPRQWALIHIEQQWEDNHLTVQGQWLHRNVDNPMAMERNKNVVHLRSVALISRELGFTGIADLLELTATDNEENAIIVPKYPGRWTVFPIEYKHGKPKYNEIDEVQLCAQAMCLEEMYGIHIFKGAFFYESVRRRAPVFFSQELREQVKIYSSLMHDVFAKGITPKAEYQSYCRSCSLKDKCFVNSLRRSPTVNFYLKQMDSE